MIHTSNSAIPLSTPYSQVLCFVIFSSNCTQTQAPFFSKVLFFLNIAQILISPTKVNKVFLAHINIKNIYIKNPNLEISLL